eukprot:TRINITY_DN1646_c0_g1_i12.p1 TRINITY_DN1646_c0_g1~~TRINITY_DN1646_c0_g1_i12.p1  ORF type:complete len:409 (-),score=17.77 TRINITY_DN1646_c0_g1_i12:1300-2526(-)
MRHVEFCALQDPDTYIGHPPTGCKVWDVGSTRVGRELRRVSANMLKQTADVKSKVAPNRVLPLTADAFRFVFSAFDFRQRRDLVSGAWLTSAFFAVFRPTVLQLLRVKHIEVNVVRMDPVLGPQLMILCQVVDSKTLLYRSRTKGPPRKVAYHEQYEADGSRSKHCPVLLIMAILRELTVLGTPARYAELCANATCGSTSFPFVDGVSDYFLFPRLLDETTWDYHHPLTAKDKLEDFRNLLELVGADDPYDFALRSMRSGGVGMLTAVQVDQGRKMITETVRETGKTMLGHSVNDDFEYETYYAGILQTTVDLQFTILGTDLANSTATVRERLASKPGYSSMKALPKPAPADTLQYKVVAGDRDVSQMVTNDPVVAAVHKKAKERQKPRRQAGGSDKGISAPRQRCAD